MTRIEATTKRLEMGELLAETLSAAAPEEVAPLAYMLLGQLAPDHEGLEVGLAEKMVYRLIARGSGVTEDRIRDLFHASGDLGLVAEELWSGPRAGQTGLDAFTGGGEVAPRSVLDVHGTLVAIAAVTGEGSQEDKLARAWRLLDKASPVEARYLVRFLVGKLRLGVADMTLLDGAAIAFAPEEEVPVGEDDQKRAPASWRVPMERAYNLTSDIGEVLRVARVEGLAAIEAVHIAPGNPVRPMLAERATDAEEIFKNVGTPALAELKYDGLRSQAHLDAAGEVHLFSRRLERVTPQFPDVVTAVREAFEGHTVVVEGEAVPIDPDTGRIRPFQDIARRRGRKHGLEAAVKEVPIHLYLFDLLYLDGEDLTALTLPERRARLGALLGEHPRVHLSTGREVEEVGDLEAFFEDAVAQGAEGIMVKSLGENATYQAGARGWRWVKYKKDYVAELADSLDLVIVGAWMGRGRRAGWYGALLGAAYDPSTGRYETVCKIGTGFKDEDLAGLNDVLDPHRTEGCPSNVACELEPDVYFEPTVVGEVRGAELTRSPVHTAARGPEGGLALRFPRFLRWREDKGPEDATTVEEVVAMWARQRSRSPGSADA